MLRPIVYVDLLDTTRDQARERLLNRVKGIRLKPDEPPLFPGSPQHEAVPERASFPSGDRFTPAPAAAGAGSWIARHKEIAFGGTGAAVIGALLTWWLSGAPTPTGIDIKNEGGRSSSSPEPKAAGTQVNAPTPTPEVPPDRLLSAAPFRMHLDDCVDRRCNVTMFLRGYDPQGRLRYDGKGTFSNLLIGQFRDTNLSSFDKMYFNHDQSVLFQLCCRRDDGVVLAGEDREVDWRPWHEARPDSPEGYARVLGLHRY